MAYFDAIWGGVGKQAAAGVLADVTVTIDLRDEKASHWPFGSRHRRSRFEPQRVAIEDANGKVLDERADGVYLSYDSMASLIAPYESEAALAVARYLDAKIESLLTAAAQ